MAERYAPEVIARFIHEGENIVWTQHRLGLFQNCLGALSIAIPLTLISLFLLFFLSFLSPEFANAQLLSFYTLLLALIYIIPLILCYASWYYVLSEFNIYYGITDKATYIVNTTWPSRYRRYGPDDIANMHYGLWSLNFSKYREADIDSGGVAFGDMEHFRDIKNRGAVIKALKDILRNAGYGDPDE